MSVPEAEPSVQPLFSVATPECDEIVLTPDRWNHACDRHLEVAPFIEEVRQALETANLVYETPHKKPTHAYYKRELLTHVPRFRGCYVAVYVRYTMQPAQVWTVYLPTHLSRNPGRLIRAER
jgi:hypothetical protein